MKRVYQQFPEHRPEQGIIGDCIRAAIASILDLPLSRVPHYVKAYWPDAGRANREIDRFVLKHGYMLVILPGTLFAQMIAGNGADILHLILGVDGHEHLPHSCVGRNGRIVHDPDPRSPGLAGSLNDWQIGLFVKTFK